MNFQKTDSEITLQLNNEEFRFLYMIVYVAIHFVDKINFATVTGCYKEEAQKFLDQADQDIGR